MLPTRFHGALKICPTKVKLIATLDERAQRALTNSDPWMCALAIMNYQHDIACEGAVVVDTFPSPFTNTMQAHEAWHICQEPRPICRDRGLLMLYMHDSLIRSPPDIPVL